MLLVRNKALDFLDCPGVFMLFRFLGCFIHDVSSDSLTKKIEKIQALVKMYVFLTQNFKCTAYPFLHALTSSWPDRTSEAHKCSPRTNTWKPQNNQGRPSNDEKSRGNLSNIPSCLLATFIASAVFCRSCSSGKRIQ